MIILPYELRRAVINFGQWLFEDPIRSRIAIYVIVGIVFSVLRKTLKIGFRIAVCVLLAWFLLYMLPR